MEDADGYHAVADVEQTEGPEKEPSPGVDSVLSLSAVGRRPRTCLAGRVLTRCQVVF